MGKVGAAVVLSMSLGLPASALAGALTLADALGRARAANPQLAGAQADLAAARGRAMQAGVLAPNPVLSGDVARHSSPDLGVRIDRGVALGQEIEIGGQRGLRVEAARHDVARAELALADRVRTVDGEARRAFAGVVAAERRRTLADERLHLADRLVDAARKRARAGDVGTLEVELGEIEHVSAEQGRAAAEADRARAVDRLATVLGVPLEEELAVVGEDLEVAAPPSETTLVARALAARPDLAAAREERARLDAEATLTRRRGNVPNPTLRGWYREEQKDEHIAGGGVDLPLPLFDRQVGAEIEQRAQASAAAADAERLAREIPRAVRLGLIRRATAAAAWERYRRDALPAAAKVRTRIEQAYAGGYLGLPDVLVQQGRLVDLQSAAIGAWLELHEAEADLIEAVGGEVP
jgi:cobalt-zinc-cadmium efflux system outer membrane protein